MDIMGLKGLNFFFCEGKSEIMFICLFCFGLLNLHRNLIFSTVWPNNLCLELIIIVIGTQKLPFA